MPSNLLPLEQDFEIFWKKNNPEENGNVKFALSSLSDNLKSSHKVYLKSYYLIVVVFGVFYLLDQKIASNKSFSIFSIEISNVTYIQWVIQLLVSFLYYQGTCAFYQEYLIRKALEKFISVYLPDLDEQNLEQLIVGQSFLGFELFQSSKYGSKTSTILIVTTIFTLLIIPLFILSYIVYRNITHWSSIESIAFKIFILILTLLFCVRAVLIIMEQSKRP